MGAKPTPAHSLDRIDNNKGYSPENCRWATKLEQAANKQRTRFVVIEGVRYRAMELAQINNRKLDTIMKRVAKGLPYEKVIQAKRVNNPRSREISAHAVAIGVDLKMRATHCTNGHEWTGDNTRILATSGNRRCITCLRAAELRARQKRYAPKRLQG